MLTDQESLLDDLLDLDSGFTGWEIEFLDSLSHWRDRELTEKQLDTLHDIARKAGLIK